MILMTIYQAIFWISLLLVLYVYFLYPVVLSVSLFFYQKPLIKDNSGEYLPFVSIIMAAYNEEACIERKIQNCFALDYPKDKIEIIIGSDGSDDTTNKIVEKYANKQISFSPYPVRRGKMPVINDGVRRAKGEICVFTDVSEMFERDAIKKLVSHFVDPSIGAVTGNHLYNPSSTELGKGTLLYWRYQRWLQRKESCFATILACDGTIYACRRKLFIPPPMGTINDDKAVPMTIARQGYRVIFEPEAIARGDVLLETKAFFQQKVRGQAGMYQLFWLYRNMFWPKNFAVWFIFLSHSVGPVVVPWLLLMILLSSLMLCSIYPYGLFFLLQLIFYFSSIISIIADRSEIHIPILHVPYFFVISNVASIAGFWSFLFKLQKATWKKVE